MIPEVYSEHESSMRLYTQACLQAKASNTNARKQLHQEIEDNLVAGGQVAIDEYENLMIQRRKEATCLAEHDGVSIGFAILKRAKERLGVVAQ